MTVAAAAAIEPTPGPTIEESVAREVKTFVINETEIRDINGDKVIFPKCPYSREQRISHTLAEAIDYVVKTGLLGGEKEFAEILAIIASSILRTMPETILKIFAILLDKEDEQEEIGERFELAQMIEVVRPFLAQRQEALGTAIGPMMAPLFRQIMQAADKRQRP